MNPYSNDSRYYPLPFAADTHAPQYPAEQRERVLAHYPQQLGNRPTPNALHAQEYDGEDLDPRFRSYGYSAHQQAEIEWANRAIHDQAVRDRKARIRDYNFVAFEALLEEEHLFAHHRAHAETFLAQAETSLNHAPSNVPFPDEPSLKGQRR